MGCAPQIPTRVVIHPNQGVRSKAPSGAGIKKDTCDYFVLPRLPKAGGWHLPLFFLLLLLVAKVAQKPRTAFLAGTRATKAKTNATQAKRLPSLFLHAFAALALHDCTRQSLLRRQCKVRVYGAPTAQVYIFPFGSRVLKKIPVNVGVALWGYYLV